MAACGLEGSTSMPVPTQASSGTARTPTGRNARKHQRRQQQQPGRRRAARAHLHDGEHKGEQLLVVLEGGAPLGPLLALQLLELGERRAEKLQHDGAVDVGDDAQREDAHLADAAACEGGVGRRGAGGRVGRRAARGGQGQPASQPSGQAAAAARQRRLRQQRALQQRQPSARGRAPDSASM
jgi:hypothetical protein